MVLWGTISPLNAPLSPFLSFSSHSQDTVFTFRRDIGSNVICLLGQLTYIDYLICHQKINTGVGASANHTSKSNSERNLSKKKINTVKKLVFVLPWLVCVCETHPGWSSNHRPASISALTSFHMDKMSTWVQCFQKAISQQSKHYFHLLWLPGQRKHQDVHSQTGSHTVLLKTLDLDRLYWQWRINGLIIPIWQHFCENGSILWGCQNIVLCITARCLPLLVNVVQYAWSM